MTNSSPKLPPVGEWIDLGNGTRVRRRPPREQSGFTKRVRTRMALLSAGREAFAEHGWDGARMADVAKQAGCSVKTLYNHFPTKRDLMLFIYFRSVAPLQEEGQHLLDDGSSPLEVAKFVISKFAKYVSNNRTLTAAAVAALHDQKLEYPEPGDHDLPENRGLPVLVAILADLIDIGREQGGIAAGPSSFELATYHVMGLMVAATMHAELTENQLVELVLSQFLPALTASQSHHGPGAGDHYQSDTAAELNQAE